MPESTPSRRNTWLRRFLAMFLTGVCLFAGGVVLSALNPYWHMTTEYGGFVNRFHSWNLIAFYVTAAGLGIAWCALVASVIVYAATSRPAGSLMRGFGGWRGWPFARAVLLGTVLAFPAYLCLRMSYDFPFADRVWDSLIGEYGARFEWNTSSGFTTFSVRVSRKDTGWDLVANKFWRSLVAFQMKPKFDLELKASGWQRVNGSVWTRVFFLFPVVIGGHISSWEDPDETPLMRAAAHGDLVLVKGLLISGTNANAHDQSGQTVLFHACMRGGASPALIKLLLDAGADVNAANRKGQTPLLAAVYAVAGALYDERAGFPNADVHDRKSVLRMLLAARGEVSRADQRGLTPLMMAAYADAETASLLLAAGADVNARSVDGYTALSLAQKEKKGAIVQLLQRSGAKP